MEPLPVPKFAAVAAQLRADDADEYLQLLRTMDWQYEFADSSVIRNRGRAKFLRIRELQPTVDRDLSLFKAYRPDSHGVPSIEVAA